MSQPLSMSDKARQVWSHPAGRTYAIIALAALVICCFPMFLQGQMPQAGLLIIVGLCGTFLQMGVMPHAILLLMIYCVSTPYGIFPIYSSVSQISDHYGNVFDIHFVGSMLVYFIAQFRLLTVVSTGMPGPSRLIDLQKPRKQRTIMRYAGRLTDNELYRLFGTALAFVTLGQIIWYVSTTLRIKLDEIPKFQYMRSGLTLYNREYLSEWSSRVTMIFGGLVFFAIVVTYLFWYWRRCAMNRDEGLLALTDMGWSENRRELSRLETWREWALHPKKKAETNNSVKTLGCILVVVLLIPLAIVMLMVVLGVMMLTGTN